ncbi:MAG: hypothetical protein LBU17_00680 [Treponema sp.]|jgi:hypothetical protein|nr:hypothetical protein [Treponema sp.]
MQFKKMTVCNVNGRVPDADKDTLVPVTANNPYQFYATTDTADSTKRVDVTIVMPLGGVQSGLFRFPRVGESVMVGVPGEDDADMSGTNYLMGYIPDTSGNYFDSTGTTHPEMLDKEGEVFRYKKSGTNAPDEAYSEIGFYNDETKWKDDTGNNPKIDRINIQSTGDIYEKAQNYNGMQAKRMEISIGDDKDLPQTAKAGDLSIDTKHDITISSDSSITLKVGRSTITINDTGIIIKSAKHSGTVTNTWDSSLTISPTDGIVALGSHASIKTINDFSIADGYGGGISSDIGVVRIGGVDIKVGTSNLPTYIKGTGSQMLDLGMNMLAMIENMAVAVGDSSSNKNVKNLGGSQNALLSSLIGVCRGGAAPRTAAISEGGGQNYVDTVGAMVGAMKLASLIAGTVATVLSLTIPAWGIGKDTSNVLRSTINTALAITEGSLALAVAEIIADYKITPPGATVMVTPEHKATIHLQANSMLYYEAAGSKKTSTVDNAYEAPLAGVALGALANISGKYPGYEGLLKALKPITMLGMKYYSDPELDKL